MSSSGGSKRQRAGSSGADNGGGNAFAVLMKGSAASSHSNKAPASGKKRPRPSSSSGSATKGQSPNTSDGSRFIECPACLKHVLMDMLNAHLDGGCSSTGRAGTQEEDKKQENDVVAHDVSAVIAAQPSPLAQPTGIEVKDNEEKNGFTNGKTDIVENDEKNTSPREDTGIDRSACEKHAAEPAQKTDPQPVAIEMKGTEDKDGATKAKKSNSEKTSQDIRIRNISSSRVDAGNPALKPASPDYSPKPAAAKKAPAPSYSAPGGIFAKMMTSSQELFSTKASVTHHFHLHDLNGRLSWTDNSGGDTSSSADISNAYLKAEWSESVKIRPLSGLNDGEHDILTKGKEIELVVSSSIKSAALTTSGSGYGLVKRHSRLSVPVLKSILQKSIRRRRPLPAVRVAMELADKSFGDLIRRMSIMILEDSMLHPDFPLLVWLMVAESKGFKPPLQLMQRIMRIVFEVASCPIKDSLTSVDDEQASAASGEDDDIASALGQEYETLLRSMLLRVSYGGMKCDTSMLMRYEKLWRYRFLLQQRGPKLSPMQTQDAEGLSQADNNASRRIEDNARVPVAGGDHIAVLWSDLPNHVNKKAKSQSMNLVPAMITNKIEKLKASDCCAAGVDFHCSGVLESVLSDGNVFSSLLEHMKDRDIPSEGSNRNEWALGIARTCMWKFSSGVNYKRDLIGGGDDSNVSAEDAKLKALWEQVLSEPAKKYMDNYISVRLIP